MIAGACSVGFPGIIRARSRDSCQDAYGHFTVLERGTRGPSRPRPRGPWRCLYGYGASVGLVFLAGEARIASTGQILYRRCVLDVLGAAALDALHKCAVQVAVHHYVAAAARAAFVQNHFEPPGAENSRQPVMFLHSLVTASLQVHRCLREPPVHFGIARRLNGVLASCHPRRVHVLNRNRVNRSTHPRHGFR